MAYTTIDKSSLHYNTKLYTGTGSSNAVTGVGFQPDLCWIKNRGTTTATRVFDSVRTATKVLYTSETDAEATAAQGLTAFGADGFTVGTSSAINGSSNNICSWNWKAGTTGSGTTTGTGTGKAYSYSVNTTAGFSIIKYLGNGNAGQQIPHHLGAVPHFIMLKPLDRTDNWRVYHHKQHDSSPANYQLKLNSTNAIDSGSDVWNDTIPTSTYFTLGSNAGVCANDENFIAYCFTEKVGYSKFGSYVGNGNAGGTFVYTGFKPQFIIQKPLSTTQNWQLHDTKRPGYNVKNYNISPNNTNAEADNEFIDILSNGFKNRTSGVLNVANNTHVYIAFGQSIVGSNNVPCTAR